ncbi:hypothetical protein NPIL_67291 [Nephila pilipes]|uniref:Uncharacterized protein n=1 Tax=Nephila pilipes TaxID=299642 RepID=A0A8X6UE62_NEPPI|nr:hypothetical protein NPIL_67291 [Nephila pilipes]
MYGGFANVGCMQDVPALSAGSPKRKNYLATKALSTSSIKVRVRGGRYSLLISLKFTFKLNRKDCCSEDNREPSIIPVISMIDLWIQCLCVPRYIFGWSR